MGMFDWVDASAFEFPFEIIDSKFQTKDFDCCMDTLIINADGNITRVYDMQEEVPEEERPYFGKPEWDAPLGKFIGCMRRKETVTEPLALPERETYHFYNSLKADHKVWVDVYADVENHKIVQFRWETKRFEDGAENIIARGVVYVNKKDTEDEATA